MRIARVHFASGNRAASATRHAHRDVVSLTLALHFALVLGACVPGAERGESPPSPSSTSTVSARAPNACRPQCDRKTCGPDGCGGTCGTCRDGVICIEGRCPSAGARCVPTQWDTCANGERCIFVGEDTHRCMPDASGLDCDACAPWDLAGAYACRAGVCRALCRFDSDCTGSERCAEGACVVGCNPLSRTCPSGSTCRVTRPNGAFVCECGPSGALGENDVCDEGAGRARDRCGTDMMCATRDGERRCRRLCDVNHPCPPGDRCEEILPSSASQPGVAVCIPADAAPCASPSCGENGVCRVEGGRARCECGPGFIAEGSACVRDAPQIDLVSPASPSTAACVSVVGRARTRTERVFIRDGGCAGVLLQSAVADASGRFSATVCLGVGRHTLHATAANDTTRCSEPVAHERLAPPGPPLAPRLGDVTPTGAPGCMRIAGTTSPHADVHAYAPYECTTSRPLASCRADDNGRFTITVCGRAATGLISLVASREGFRSLCITTPYTLLSIGWPCDVGRDCAWDAPFCTGAARGGARTCQRACGEPGAGCASTRDCCTGLACTDGACAPAPPQPPRVDRVEPSDVASGCVWVSGQTCPNGRVRAFPAPACGGNLPAYECVADSRGAFSVLVCGFPTSSTIVSVAVELIERDGRTSECTPFSGFPASASCSDRACGGGADCCATTPYCVGSGGSLVTRCTNFCADDGVACRASSDCCAGLGCIGGLCRATAGDAICAYEGSWCASGWQCCGDLWCVDGVCQVE
jgi:hypothetical protein